MAFVRSSSPCTPGRAIVDGRMLGACKATRGLPGWIPVAATLGVALIGMSAALADDRPSLDCTIRFQLSGWSSIYESVDGTGIVACADGTSLPVLVQARGAGLAVGQSKVTSGTGRFISVHEISDVIGTYAQADVHAGVVKSDQVQLLTNDKVSLALVGKGEDDDLGIAGFMIRPQ